MNRDFDELPVNVNPVKSYPFAFNSYNLDEEQPKVRFENSHGLLFDVIKFWTILYFQSEASSENQVVHRKQPDQTVDIGVNEPNEKEKEEFVNKLFG